jgi:hypothetical protein
VKLFAEINAEWIEVELRDAAAVALTKQVNNIVSLGTRQASYTNTVSAPRTAKNIRTFQHLGLVGAKTRVPYKRIRCGYMDDETGDWVIYNGWMNVVETAKDYKLYIYEGVIDFFKSIENKTLTEIGIADLNHIKNVTTVIESWANDRPYMYIIADYNGKNVTTPIVVDPDGDGPDEPETIYVGGDLNIDYMVPSFRMSYVWERIFAYAGFTYSGSVFSTERFLNWWSTYPKPVPVNTPIVTPISDQLSQIATNPVSYPDSGGGIFLGAVYSALLFPDTFDTAEANNVPGYIVFDQDGAFRLRCEGTLTSNGISSGLVNWTHKDAGGLIKASGTLDAAATDSNDNEIVLIASTGDTLALFPQRTGSNSPGGYYPLEGEIHSYLDLVLGYDANFEEALIDFPAKKIIDEVMQHFALTPFTDKYSKNIEFLTLDEIIQNTDVVDWSGKYQGGKADKYRIGSYAKRNNYQYRYNDENEKHNDGFIAIDNENLEDETTVLSSSFYAPEKLKTAFLGQRWNVYKIWDREIKEDNTVDYKELTGRFYLLRNEPYTYAEPITVKSESLNTTEDVTTIQRESYYRLNLQEVLFDNYQSIGKILNDAQLSDLPMYLTSVDVENFDFKRLIFVKQLSSYFIVNKISNYVKGKITKVEAMAVAYYSEGDEIDNPTEGSYISILEATPVGCEVEISFDTDAPLPASIRVVATRETFGGIPGPDDLYDQTFVTSGPITIDLPGPGFWTIRLYLTEIIYSTPVTIDNLAMCEAPPPADCEPTGVVITNVQRFNANFPLPSGAGSQWIVNFDLLGVPAPDSGICNPYDLLAILVTNLGTQSFTVTDSYVAPSLGMSLQLPLRPTSASVKIYFTNPVGVTFESNTYFWP